MTGLEPAPSILVTGQCTLHWGRMEFGNLGNYYISEPFFGELRRQYPKATLSTTLQMSDAFCQKHALRRLPLEAYYAWSDSDLLQAHDELEWARAYATSGRLPNRSLYIDAVLAADLVVNFSGDMWGDNADLAGAGRFEVGLCKDRVAQLLGKPVALLAGSPGPFKTIRDMAFAREVFSHYSLVTNREPLSASILSDWGFSPRRVHTRACPAFLFGESISPPDRPAVPLPSATDDHPVVGVVVCGWNFADGPFDRWPRADQEYGNFAAAVECLTSESGAKVRLFSHSNGFPPFPAPFKLLHGRDYPIAKQLESVVRQRGKARDVEVLDGIYSGEETWTMIGSLSMLVSGRVHAAVAALSQGIPTVILDYGHNPRAHKLRGLAQLVGIEPYVADPADAENLLATIRRCWQDRHIVREHLARRIPEVQALARRNFSDLRPVLLGVSAPEVDAP